MFYSFSAKHNCKAEPGNQKGIKLYFLDYENLWKILGQCLGSSGHGVVLRILFLYLNKR